MPMPKQRSCFLRSRLCKSPKKLSILFCLLASVILVSLISQVDVDENPAVICLKETPMVDDLLSKLTADGVRLVLLDARLLSHVPTRKPSTTTFGVFENDLEKFRGSLNSTRGWNVVESHGKDYRHMRPTKAQSIHVEVIRHIFFVSAPLVVHVAVIFPRNNFYWIAGIRGLPPKYEYLARLKFGIPLPMAIEVFNCIDIHGSIDSPFNVCVPDDLDFYLWQLPHAHFHECHYDDIVFPFKTNHTLIELNNTNLQALAFGEAVRITKELRVPAVLFGSSLLGWYRQCNQIVESMDGDLLIWADEYKEEVLYRLFRSKVLKVCCRYGSPKMGLKYRTHTVAEPNFWLDIILLYPTADRNKFEYFLWVKDFYSLEYPRRKGVCSAELFGILVYIPCNYVDFLNAGYGKGGWMKPPHDYSQVNMKKIREYEENEAKVMEFAFKDFTCPMPNPMWGCDQVPPEVINSDFYKNISESK